MLIVRQCLSVWKDENIPRTLFDSLGFASFSHASRVAHRRLVFCEEQRREEALVADVTPELPLLMLRPHVFLQVPSSLERLPALVTLVLQRVGVLCVSMHVLQVLAQVALAVEGVCAVRAGVWGIGSVRLQMA